MTPINSKDELKTKAPDSSSEAGYTIIPKLYEYCLGVGLELSNYQAVELTKLILADRKKHELEARIDPFDFVESCEPDCDNVRHAYHQGQWDMATRIEAKQEEV